MSIWHFVSHRIASYRIPSNCITSCHIVSHHIASHCIALHCIALHRITSQRISSHRIASDCIVSYGIISQKESIAGLYIKDFDPSNSSTYLRLHKSSVDRTDLLILILLRMPLATIVEIAQFNFELMNVFE